MILIEMFLKQKLEIHPVKWIEQVLSHALEREPVPLLEEAEAVTPIPALNEAANGSQITTH